MNSPGSLAGRLLDWHGRHHKPWVAVVDGGAPFDAMVRRLEKGGVPTFRTADRAMRLLEIFCQERLRVRTAATVLQEVS